MTPESVQPPQQDRITDTAACEWCGRAVAQNAEGRWYAVKGEERGYDPLTCDASDDRRHLDGYCRDPKVCTDPHKDREQVDQRLREHAADVANMSLMFLDRLGLLPEEARNV